MTDEPTAKPVAMPDPEPMVAILLKLLLQNPPASVLLSVAVAPRHTEVTPLMGDGSG